MKKSFLTKVGILMASSVLLFATACGSGGEKVTVSGSTSVLTYMQMLAEAYMRQSETEIEVGSGGSSAGVQNVKTNVSHVGMSSRDLTADEAADFNVYEIAIDGLAIIVHPSNPVAGLGTDQIRAIYSGKIKDWSEVGGSAGSITLVTREDGSGTRDAFQELVMGGRDGDSIMDDVIIQNSNGVIKATVAGNENAIGYVSVGITLGATDIKALSIDGIEATVKNIEDEVYELFRKFFIFTKKDDVKPETKAFVDFIMSDAGQSVIEKAGLVRGVR